MTIIKKSANNKCWKRCRGKGTLLCCWWECKLILPLWGTVVNFLRNIKNRTAIWPINPNPGHMPSSVQFSHSVISDSLWPHEPQHARPPCPSPTPTVHPNPCPLSQWCHPTISSSCPLLLLPSIFPSIRVFSNELALRSRWPKCWSFSLNISPSNEYPGLISFGMDWLDLLAVQGTLKSLLQHHSSKASILQHSASFTVQLTSIHDHWKNHSVN